MKNLIKNSTFLLLNRFILFSVFVIGFMIVQYVAFDSVLPTADSKDMWFYSGVAMVLFSILFIEPYYSSPKNVITNAIPLLLVFLSIKSTFENLVFWWIAVSVLLVLVTASIIAMTLEDKDKSPECRVNSVSNWIKKIVVLVGQGKILYSSAFIYFLLTYHSIQSLYTVTLFILWAVIICINPKLIHNSFSFVVKRKEETQIGNIFSVQSKKLFLVKLYEDKTNISKFDVVKFKYSMQASDQTYLIGIIFDTYLLDQEKWVKVLHLEDRAIDLTDNLENNVVYKIAKVDELRDILKSLKIEKFVGVVIEGSTIGKIKFEYSKKKDDLQEGDLLELKIDGKRLFYQADSNSKCNTMTK